MLCSKIIFTKEDVDCSVSLTDFMNAKAVKYKIHSEEDATEIEAETDDEGLYQICCELTRYIRDRIIKFEINKKLTRVYACFNADEKGIILSNVLSHDFMKEIPGRMYVYLKVNKGINPFAFYRFMCRDISNLIDNATSAEADRIVAINDEADFVDLLKYFAQISSDSADSVELTASGGEVKITGCMPDNEVCMTEYGYCDADVLAELVTMNPQKIEIKGKEEFLKTEIAGVITAVFEDRIYYK